MFSSLFASKSDGSGVHVFNGGMLDVADAEALEDRRQADASDGVDDDLTAVSSVGAPGLALIEQSGFD